MDATQTTWMVTNEIGVPVCGPFASEAEAHAAADTWEDSTGNEASVMPTSETEWASA